MEMNIYTNKNNTNTLKLLVAAHLAGVSINNIYDTTFEDDVILGPRESSGRNSSHMHTKFQGPRLLPRLAVDDQITFFSSNAAVLYLYPVIDPLQNGQCQQIQEWEATRLYPVVATAVSGKVPSDLKETVASLLLVVDDMLQGEGYIVGNCLSGADICIWSTLYPLYFNEDLNSQYKIRDYKHIAEWADLMHRLERVQTALVQWGGSAKGPFGAHSALGIPQLASLVSLTGDQNSSDSTEEADGPSPEEMEAAEHAWHHGLEELQAPIKQEKIVLPVKGHKNVLITSALPYVNNVPHLGNIIGCVLSADIFARYCRICDYNTLYICGTDEYGTATETKALEERVTPKQLCDKYYDIHNSVYRWFNIGFDYFGRTSTKEQTEISQEMFLKLVDNGFVSAHSVDQLFCEKCDRFLADRFVEGVCPAAGCGYAGARGDQCDRCGRLVNAVELGAPRCKLCAHPPQVRASRQLFIDLPALEPSIRSWILKEEQNWSPPARAVTKTWLKEPLRARAVTRDLKWGVQVPVAGFENKVFYVWFDAPIGYLSITQAFTKDYKKWWKPDKEYDVKLYQFMAKDNVPFHVIMFPATLLGVNEGHVMVNNLFATEYLNYEDGKFSKSRGVGVFGTDAQDTGIPSDVWRFYLTSIRPETSDSSFSWTELGTRNNSELLNNLGNFCHRSLSFCASSFKGRVPDVTLSATDYALIALINREVIAYVRDMERGRLREALRHVMSVSRHGNQHMQLVQPWVLLKGSDDDKIRGATAVGVCCQIVALLSTLLSPYLPDTSRRLREQLKIDATNLRINPLKPSFIRYLPEGHVIGKPEPLFIKIEQARLDELRAKYAGTQTERATKRSKGLDVADLEEAITQQGEKVRQMKSTSKDKSVWQPEVDKLLELKRQLTVAQKTQVLPAAGASVASLEKAVAEQGDKVRQLKSTTKDKSVWQPEVDKLLELKKQLTAAQKAQEKPVEGASVASLEKAVAEQGDKVRQLKSATKDKAAWKPELDKLLDLKKQLMAAHRTQEKQDAGDSVASLEKAIAAQGDKVRTIKASTKDKAVWQPEVNILLDLKKRLAALQSNN